MKITTVCDVAVMSYRHLKFDILQMHLFKNFDLICIKCCGQIHGNRFKLAYYGELGRKLDYLIIGMFYSWDIGNLRKL